MTGWIISKRYRRQFMRWLLKEERSNKEGEHSKYH